MNKNTTNLDDNLIKKFNLKEARVSLIPCDGSNQDVLSSQFGNVQTDAEFQDGTEGIIYVASDCLNSDFIDIFCPQDGNTLEQTCGMNLLIPQDFINSEGTLIVQQGDCLSGILLPVMDDPNIRVVRNGEIHSSNKVLARVENMSDQNATGLLFCSDPCANVTSLSEGTLQNDVMLGQITVETSKGNDDDDLVGELRKCLPRRNELLGDVMNDISEYGMDWHGDLEWNLEQTSVNEGAQTKQISEGEKLNEEFSKRMREEFAASFIKKNSLMELKKKIGNVKCPKKKGPEETLDNTFDKRNKPYKEENKQGEVAILTTNHKRNITFGSEPPQKKPKNEIFDDIKSKTSQVLRKDEEFDKIKLKKTESCIQRINKNVEKRDKKRPGKNQTTNDICKGLKCGRIPRPGSVYCSDECIESHVQHSIKLLHVHNVENMTERVVVLDRRTGKLITGPLAPTLNNLLTWIQKHPSFEVLQPKGMPSSQKISKRPPFVAENISSKSSKGMERNSCLRNDHKKSEEIAMKASIDSQRISVRRYIVQRLLSKTTESVMMTTLEIKHLAIDLENSVFQNHKSVDGFYRRHCQGLFKLIKQASNEILNGEISVDDFVKKALLEDDDILSTDRSTSKHDQHVYDINCQICNPFISADIKKLKHLEDKSTPSCGKILSPDVTSTTDFCGVDLSNSSKAKIETLETLINSQDIDHKPSSSCFEKNLVPDALIDKVWSGFLSMKDVAKFALSAFRTSGSMKLIRKSFPATLTVLGRISKEVVENYVRTIKTTCSYTKEIGVICFVYDENDGADQESYETFFHYLHSRERCGVIGSIGSAIKDVYIWPLPSTHAIPSFLTPFVGPGLDVNRGDLLLGIIVQQCSNHSSVPIGESQLKLENEANVKEGDDDDNDDDDDDDEEDKNEYAIISGGCSKDKKKEIIGGDFTPPLPRIEKNNKKVDEDKPYDPTEVCPAKELSPKVLDDNAEEIQKKFDTLFEVLNKKPEMPFLNSIQNKKSTSYDTPSTITMQFVECPTESSTQFEKSHVSSINLDQASQCQAATAALASLNIFLEKYIAQKKLDVKPCTVVNESQTNFNLCEITNEQHQLMKQVLEMVKARSNKNCSMRSGLDLQKGNVSTVSTKYPQKALENNCFQDQQKISYNDANGIPLHNYSRFYHNMDFRPNPSYIINTDCFLSESRNDANVINQNSYRQSHNNNFFKPERHEKKNFLFNSGINQENGFAASNHYFWDSHQRRFRQRENFHSFNNFEGKNDFDRWIGR